MSIPTPPEAPSTYRDTPRRRMAWKEGWRCGVSGSRNWVETTGRVGFKVSKRENTAYLAGYKAGQQASRPQAA